MTTKYSNHKLALAITAAIMAAGGAQAYEVPLTYFGTNMPPMDFHGFVSQGFLQSDKYNYLGDTTRGSFLFTEAGLNASINPFPRTRITAQAFTFDVGQKVGKYDVFLDYASLEYTFNDNIGVRAGRIRRPLGIYNDIQDVDLARTWVLLPQGIYDARQRDFSCSLDGGDLFGEVSLSKAGSLSYELYGGMINLSDDGGIAQSIRDTLPPGATLEELGSFPGFGIQLWWHTPVDGLRAGFNISHGSDIQFHITQPVPPIGTVFPNQKIDANIIQGSLEYLWKSWTFQSEYNQTVSSEKTEIRSTFMPTTTSSSFIQGDAWYVSAAYRFNKYVESGMYYTEAYSDIHQRDNSLKYQKDAALSLRFDLKDWWIFKVEGHYIRGTGLLQDNASNPVSRQDDQGWFMLALKTTFSF